jgi:UDP-glucose 4-epimerase
MARDSGKVLVTGAGGFVGTALCQQLKANGIAVLPGKRGVELLPEMAVDAVVHLAARVHMMQETLSDSLSVYREVNTQGTLNLARQAAVAGVQRFVFVSTVKVNGEGRLGIYSESDTPNPTDPYAISKWEAERGLRDIATNSGMEIVIVRPPLIYGPGVKANFLSMMRWLSRGVPLPLGAIHNKRSLVGLANLVDLLITCLDHPAAANQTFLVSDGEDLSTTELFVRMAAALGKPARLIPVPAWMLAAGASLLGKRDLSQRLCGSLRVDISKARSMLGWSPPVSVDEGLRVTAEHYLAELSG